jgi:hypothetical protein
MKQTISVWDHYNEVDAVSYSISKQDEGLNLQIKRHHKGRTGHNVVSNNTFFVTKGTAEQLIIALQEQLNG